MANCRPEHICHAAICVTLKQLCARMLIEIVTKICTILFEYLQAFSSKLVIFILQLPLASRYGAIIDLLFQVIPSVNSIVQLAAVITACKMTSICLAFSKILLFPLRIIVVIICIPSKIFCRMTIRMRIQLFLAISTMFSVVVSSMIHSCCRVEGVNDAFCNKS